MDTLVLPFNLTYEMGQIDDILYDFKCNVPHLEEAQYTGDICSVCDGLRKILQKHLEPQKKAEVCKSCLGKKQLSEYKGVTVACADFSGDKSYVIDKGGIVIADCSRCKGTGEEPIFIPEPQQEDMGKLNDMLDEFYKKDKIKPLKFIENGMTDYVYYEKINEIINFINNQSNG